MYLYLFLISFFAFIFSIIGMLKFFFERRWKVFFGLIACILLSGACTFFLLYHLLLPPPTHEIPFMYRPLQNPL
jgi:hypothetical protein